LSSDIGINIIWQAVLLLLIPPSQFASYCSTDISITYTGEAFEMQKTSDAEMRVTKLISGIGYWLDPQELVRHG